MSKGGGCDHICQRNVDEVDCPESSSSTGFLGIRAYAISGRSIGVLLVIFVLSSVKIATQTVRVGMFWQILSGDCCSHEKPLDSGSKVIRAGCRAWNRLSDHFRNQLEDEPVFVTSCLYVGPSLILYMSSVELVRQEFLYALTHDKLITNLTSNMP